MTQSDIARPENRSAKPAEIGLPPVANAACRQPYFEFAASELRMTSTSGGASHIHDCRDTSAFEDRGKFAGRSGTVPNGQQPEGLVRSRSGSPSGKVFHL